MNFSDNNNKYVFGAYLNTAFDNFNDTIKHILHKVKPNIVSDSETKDIDKLCKVLEERNVSSFKAIEKIDKAFPFFRLIIKEKESTLTKDNQIEVGLIYAQYIKSLHFILENWRNYTTHYYHKEINSTSIGEDHQQVYTHLIKAMPAIYEKALQIVTKRFAATPQQLSHLYLTTKDGKPTDCHYTPIQQKEFSEKGLALFTCLFLHKRDAMQFMQQLKGFKDTRGKSQQYTHELYTTLRFNAPKRIMRIQQKQSDNISLGLDILNELTKCPLEIYRHLHPSKQKEFEISISDIDDTENEEDTVISKHIRFKDRYETLMLRSLEQSKACESLLFYIHLGNYIKDSYDKTYIDNSKDVRCITRQLSGFGKIKNSFYANDNYSDTEVHAFINTSEENPFLSKFGEQMQQANPGIPVTIESPDTFTPHILEAYPSYIINDNKIGIQFAPSDNDKLVLPTFDEQLRTHNPLATFWLSKYELPALAFYAYLKDNYTDKLKELPSIEAIFEENRNPKRKETTLPLKEKLIARLEHYIEDTQEEVNRINEREAKSNETVAIKSGKLADRIARDILWLQPSHANGKDKLTGSNFQALQYALARYSYMRNELSALFQRAGLIESKNKHPFLGKLNPASFYSLRSFYKAYLLERLNYLHQQLAKLHKGKINIQFQPLKALITKAQNENKEQQRCEPVFLERSIFTIHIKQALCIIHTGINHQLSKKDSNEEINAAWLIALYLKTVKKDALPEMYTANRGYQYELPSKGKKPTLTYLSLDERCFRFKDLRTKAKASKNKAELIELAKIISDNEQQIRMRGTQDTTLYLFMLGCLPKDMISNENKQHYINLRTINRELLNTPIRYKYNPEAKVIIEDSIKLKDFGRLNSFTQETLPRSFFKFISKLAKATDIKANLILSYDYLLREISAFNTYRLEVIKTVHTIEQQVTKDSSAEYKGMLQEESNFRTMLETYITDRNINFDIDPLVHIRNGFCHNQYKAELIPDEKEKLKESFLKEIHINQIITQSQQQNNSIENTLAYHLKTYFESQSKELLEIKKE